MAYVTRLRSVWHRIYQSFARLVPMMPLPPPYVPDSMDNVPSSVLEQHSIFAYQLHVNLILPVSSPTLVTCISSKIRRAPWASDDLHLLPGGRWLVEVSPCTWRVLVWDLQNILQRNSEILCATLSDEETQWPPTSAATFRGDRLCILVQGMQLESYMS